MLWLFAAPGFYGRMPPGAALRSLFWLHEAAGIEVCLIAKGPETRPYNLVVISDKDVKVIYQTERNSFQSNSIQLAPVKAAGGRSYDDVGHNLSKTTIWMTLDFESEGKKFDSLTRTFDDNFFEIAANDRFSKNNPGRSF